MWAGSVMGDSLVGGYLRILGNAAKADSGRLNFCASGLPYWTLDIGAFL